MVKGSLVGLAKGEDRGRPVAGSQRQVTRPGQPRPGEAARDPRDNAAVTADASLPEVPPLESTRPRSRSRRLLGTLYFTDAAGVRINTRSNNMITTSGACAWGTGDVLGMQRGYTLLLPNDIACGHSLRPDRG